LEEGGISTVVRAAPRIVEPAAVPRFLFSDFRWATPAGSRTIRTRRRSRWSSRCACWKPHRVRNYGTVAAALEPDTSWKRDYNNIGR